MAEKSHHSNARNGNGDRITLKALAKHLGLSPTTVSVVISDSPLATTIAAKTKERIWEAARKFNYRPKVLPVICMGSGLIASRSWFPILAMNFLHP